MGISGQHSGVDRVKAVIFDVDGTLYDQRRLRRQMLRDLLAYYLARPWRFRELMILRAYRSIREEHAGEAGNIETGQYHWCAERMGCSPDEVRQVVARWIYREPNQYLHALTYPGARRLFDLLHRQGIRVAIYSDHSATEKLQAMGLKADLVVCSTDPQVDRLKPDPAGLLHITKALGLRMDQCLFIGDRQEMDGECAIRAGMPYHILETRDRALDPYASLIKEFTPASNLSDHARSIHAI
jgi:HAD superfamily hydrolase (TIGR01549 family)